MAAIRLPGNVGTTIAAASGVRMNRASILLATTVAAWPLAALAQTASPVILKGASYELSRYPVDAFHQGLRETGYVEGKNVALDYRPANLPIQQSTKAELFVNLSTAKALGVKVPQSVLARADEVLQ